VQEEFPRVHSTRTFTWSIEYLPPTFSSVSRIRQVPGRLSHHRKAFPRNKIQISNSLIK
jgi:hypothetical protein